MLHNIIRRSSLFILHSVWCEDTKAVWILQHAVISKMPYSLGERRQLARLHSRAPAIVLYGGCMRKVVHYEKQPRWCNIFSMLFILMCCFLFLVGGLGVGPGPILRLSYCLCRVSRVQFSQGSSIFSNLLTCFSNMMLNRIKQLVNTNE